MDFELSVIIHRPLEEVFTFFRDMDQHAGQKGTLVPIYDKITPGPISVGTRYREVVRVLPFITGAVWTEIVGFEPGARLAYAFVALGMPGELCYEFEPVATGTRIVQRQSLHPAGWRRLFSPLIRITFYRMIAWRLMGIKNLLESGPSG